MAEDILQRWNQTSPKEASDEILPCNGSHAWADAMAAARPFAEAGEVFLAADTIWARLGFADWQQAFLSHPRLGERDAQAATQKSLQWSAGEQKTLTAGEAERAALMEGNRAYEERFGRVFLLCATGKSTAEVLASLRARSRNDPGAELREAAEQQRRITQLRLRKWLGAPSAGCEDV